MMLRGPLVVGDRGDDLLIRAQGVREPTLGAIADLVDARRQPGVEHDVQLSREHFGRAALQRRVQVLRRRFVVPFAGDAHESEHRPSRRLTAEWILRRFGLRRGRRRGRGGLRLKNRRGQERQDDGQSERRRHRERCRRRCRTRILPSRISQRTADGMPCRTSGPRPRKAGISKRSGGPKRRGDCRLETGARETGATPKSRTEKDVSCVAGAVWRLRRSACRLHRGQREPRLSRKG